MIQITSTHLTRSENAMIRKYAKFVLNRFVRPCVQKRAKIHIKVMRADEVKNPFDKKDFKNYGAWCTYDGTDGEIRNFSVIINAKDVNTRAKKLPLRLRQLLINLGHELVHVKQYLNNEIFDYVSGDVRYKGTYFDSSWAEDEEAYYESPWELEAYGREYGLYALFVRKLREECSQK
jgi:hypothetical protein